MELEVGIPVLLAYHQDDGADDDDDDFDDDEDNDSDDDDDSDDDYYEIEDEFPTSTFAVFSANILFMIQLNAKR